MKKLTFLLLFTILTTGIINAQEEGKKEFTPSGKAFAKVFWNYHYDMTPNVNSASAFDIKRAYLGYSYNFSEAFSTKITLDVGHDGSAYSSYLKTAQLDWKIASPIKLSLGLIGLKQFNDQEKFWGYRYTYKSFQDEHGFGSSADLGANAEIKLHKALKINIFATNGGGYKALQDEYGMHRVGANLVAQPAKGLTFKVYYDIMPGKYDVYGNDSIIADTSTISNLAFFAAYKTKKFRIGAEYNMLSNAKKYSKPAKNHTLSGISVYATYIINNKWEILGRFDQLTSNKLSGDTENWNNSNDGNAIIGGVQYAPVKGVKMALNYQSWMYNDASNDTEPIVFLNFEYTF